MARFYNLLHLDIYHGKDEKAGLFESFILKRGASVGAMCFCHLVFLFIFLRYQASNEIYDTNYACNNLFARPGTKNIALHYSTCDGAQIDKGKSPILKSLTKE